MRKTLIVLMIMVLVVTMFTTLSYAYSFGINLVPNVASVSKGGTLTLTVSLKDFDVGENGINVFLGTIDYDTNIFNTLTEGDITPLNDWGGKEFNASNGKVYVDRSAFIKENSDILSIKFTVKDSATLGKTTITIKDMQASNGEEDISATNTSYLINIVEQVAEPVKPNITVEYTTVSNGVKVTLKSDKTLKPLTGWTLAENKMSLSKIYEESYTGTVIVEDEDGLKSDAKTISVTVQKQEIDITKPTGTVKYTQTTNGVIATITASEEIQAVSGWTLSSDKKVLTKTFTVSYTGNVVLTDLAGNKSDNIEVKVEIKTQEEKGNTNTNTNTNNVVNNSNSITNNPLPKAGVEDYIIPMIVVFTICGIGAFIRFRRMEY